MEHAKAQLQVVEPTAPDMQRIRGTVEDQTKYVRGLAERAERIADSLFGAISAEVAGPSNRAPMPSAEIDAIEYAQHDLQTAIGFLDHQLNRFGRLV